LPSAAAEDYWGYSYRNVDVTVAGNSVYAVNLARYCVRLDAMLTRILGIKATFRAPTHLYALPPEQLKQLLGSDSRVSYHGSAFENTVVFTSTHSAASDYWGAYFGYTATLLSSDRRLSGPDWYLLGVPEVFAETSYQGTRATLGAVNQGYAITLTKAALIPARSFLSMRHRDAIAKGEFAREVFEAQSWFLAHQIFVEGKHRAEFGNYLDLMRDGTSETDAFAASFKITYEELDKELALAFHQRPYVYMLQAPDDPEAAGASAQHLNPAEVKGRLALLSLSYPSGPDPVQLANEALRLDASDESALRALARGLLAREAYAEAFAAVDRLRSEGGSVAANGDSADVLAGLAAAAAAGRASLPVDAATLRERARAQYERVLAVNSEDRRAQAGLAKLTRSQ
jgi:hypothetical protein